MISNKFNDYYWKLQILETIDTQSFIPHKEIMCDEVTESKSAFVNLPKESNKIVNILGFRNTHLPDNLIIATILFKNDLVMLKSLLNFGLDPNGKIFPATHIVHLCPTVEALQLLIVHGLDLKKNSPLLRVPFPVFTEMIRRYKVDPWIDYQIIDDFHKIRFLNKILTRKRGLLSQILIGSGTLINDLSEVIINCVFPSRHSLYH